jgi:hypothetical protein
MTITPRVREFPTFPISKQLFYVPGAAVQGGLTSGSAQIITPEPGGFGVLEIQPSLRDEWTYPISSWLMSKGNGHIFRVRLAPTPQVAWSRRRGNAVNVSWDDGLLWSNQQEWEGDFAATFASVALEGSTEVTIDLTGVGQILQMGHVIGHNYNTYGIDEIDYDGDTATAVLTLPLRRDVAVGDAAFTRPWFTGRIRNVSEALATYDAENNGSIQIGKLILDEAVV